MFSNVQEQGNQSASMMADFWAHGTEGQNACLQIKQEFCIIFPDNKLY